MGKFGEERRLEKKTPTVLSVWRSDLGTFWIHRGVLTGADSGCADSASTVDVSAGIPVISRL